MSYLSKAPTAGRTPQSRAIPGSSQVQNRSGGFVWEVSPMTRFRRWLILGSENGSYYAGEQELTADNVAVLDEVDPEEALDLLLEISVAGRAPKQDQILFSLAKFCVHPEEDIRKYAHQIIPDICRTATHLFQLVAFIDQHKSPKSHWGRGLRRAVGKWYARDVNQVAYQVVKYHQRAGYTHMDLLRLAHPAEKVSSHNPEIELSPQHALLFDWICGRPVKGKQLPDVARGFRRAGRKKNRRLLPQFIQDYGLPWEAVEQIDSALLNFPDIQEALLGSEKSKHQMPMGAMIRQLPRFTRSGLLKPLGKHTKFVMHQLTNRELLEKARIHPMNLLVAQYTYDCGHSLRGNSTWEPLPEIVAAMDKAFYRSFKTVEPTDKRHLLAVDISGSMTYHSVMGIPGLTPRLGAAAMALATANVEDTCHIVGFSANRERLQRIYEDHRHSWDARPFDQWITANPDSYFQEPDTWAIQPLDISPSMRLKDVQEVMRRQPAGGTDVALPMMYAIEKELEVDIFLVYTDNESWAGKIHPSQALQRYRAESGIDARMVVCAMTADKYSVADPNDPRQMDVVGFDSAAPQIISSFVRGEI